MLFLRELAEKVVAGEKTATRRLPKDNPRSPWYWRNCRYRVGGEFPVMGGFDRPALCCAIVDRVALERLGACNCAQARTEGFDSVQAFFEKCEEINGFFDAMAWVWVVEFRVRPSTEVKAA
jgi:hypothetical protein